MQTARALRVATAVLVVVPSRPHGCIFIVPILSKVCHFCLCNLLSTCLAAVLDFYLSSAFWQVCFFLVTSSFFWRGTAHSEASPSDVCTLGHDIPPAE